MFFADGWYFPDGEKHLTEWMATPQNRMVINERVAYQGKKQMAALELCNQHRTMIDVGGHIGLWSYNFSHWFERVEAFEPIAAHRDCFMKNTEGRSNIRLYPFALGDRAGKVSMHTGPASSGDSWVKGEGEIPMETLDSFSFSIKDVDLIKIDCEGYEEFVLRGAARIIDANRPVIVVEQKRDHATKFGLAAQGAVEYLKVIHKYVQVKEISGDFFMVPS